MALFKEGSVTMYGTCLWLHQLRVPILIGVNENERGGRQMVVADVEIERFDHPEDDFFAHLEDAIQTVSPASSAPLMPAG
jgi:hypothetical protein